MARLDAYTRNAQVAPAVLAGLPVAIAMFLLLPTVVSTLKAIVASLGVSFILLLLLGHLGRTFGRRRQAELFLEWGGSPSVRYLRHSDTTLDRDTKARYAQVLAAKARITLPTPEEERATPHRSDETYESATRWLLEQTRDQKAYPLVFTENVSYGFRRNIYGLKPMGLILSVIVVIVCTAVLVQHSFHHTSALIVVACNLVAIALWLLIITPQWVHEAADAYALRLLAALEQL